MTMLKHSNRLPRQLRDAQDSGNIPGQAARGLKTISSSGRSPCSVLGSWTRWTSQGPLTPNHSTILWFFLYFHSLLKCLQVTSNTCPELLCSQWTFPYGSLLLQQPIMCQHIFFSYKLYSLRLLVKGTKGQVWKVLFFPLIGQHSWYCHKLFLLFVNSWLQAAPAVCFKSTAFYKTSSRN